MWTLQKSERVKEERSIWALTTIIVDFGVDYNIVQISFNFRYNAETMDMVKMETLEERNTLPKTKWNIPQPSEDCQRDEAMETGKSNVLNSDCRF